MTATPPAMKVGEDPRSVKKGSRLIPILVLVAIIVSFLAFAVDEPKPRLELRTIAHEYDMPYEGQNLMVIGRMRGDTRALYFAVFNNLGQQLAQQRSDSTLDSGAYRGDTSATAAQFRAMILESVDALRSDLDRHWDWDQPRQDLPAAEQERIVIKTTELLARSFSVTKGDWSFFGGAAKGWAHELATGLPIVLRNQLWALLIVALYAMVPGLLGLIYRRSFGTWFTVAFLLLFVLNRGFDGLGFRLVGTVHPPAPWTESFVRILEEAVLLLLVVFRLRPHSAWAVDPARQLRARLIAAALLVSAVAVAYWWFSSAHRWYAFEGAAVLITLAFVVAEQNRSRPTAAHGKNIVVCLDGTWNQPGQKDFDQVAVTNVFKVFSLCKGDIAVGHHNASQCKVYPGTGDAKQIAFYYRGVGNAIDSSVVGQTFGGAFGMGAEGIVERAYLDVVKSYRPGDRIFICGFSRGAAIARLLANAVGRRGVPKSLWTLRLFGRHWLLWKSSKSLDVKVDVLGCWDTVGSFGIAKNIMGIPLQQINLLKDLSVSLSVKRAYHMVALDETRDAFVPTLMEPDPTAPQRVVEVWFSGNHSNVGGGYATDNLSDVALDFLLKHTSSGYAWDVSQTPGDESWGLYLSAAVKAHPGAAGGPELLEVLDPDPRGAIRHATGAVYAYAPRRLPVHAVINDSVFDRLYESLPVYAPQSLFDLNQEFVKQRDVIATEVHRLVETASIAPDDSQRALHWSTTHLSLMKWSRYIASSVDGATTFAQKLNPPVELRNPPMA